MILNDPLLSVCHASDATDLEVVYNLTDAVKAISNRRIIESDSEDEWEKPEDDTDATEKALHFGNEKAL